MKKYIAILIYTVTHLASVTIAHAETVKIGAGSADGEYAKIKISVGDEKGGTALTFQYMMKLYPDFKNITFHHKGH